MIDKTAETQTTFEVGKTPSAINRMYFVRNNELAAYTDEESLVLADVFGCLGLSATKHFCLRQKFLVWRNKTGHCQLEKEFIIIIAGSSSYM